VAAVVAVVVGTAMVLSEQLTSPQAAITGAYLPPAWLVVADVIAAGTVIVASALSSVRDPRLAWGLACLLAGLLLPTWATVHAIPAAMGAVLLAAHPLTSAGVALLAGIRQALSALALACLGCAVLALAYNPFTDPACWETCADVPPSLGALLSTGTAIRLAVLLVLAALGLTAIDLLHRQTTTHGIVAASALVAVLLLAAASILRLQGWLGRPTLLMERALPALAVAVLAAAVVRAEVRLLRTRLAMERLVAGLAAPQAQLLTSGVGVRAVLFAAPGSAGWVDESGNRVAAPSGRSLTLSDGSGPSVLLLLADHADETVALATLSPAARLALQNARLTAAGKARLAEVRASRRRIVSTSDAERRRIERDLHDGAQQRLVSVALHLQVAATRVRAPAAARLREAETQVRQTLARLRGLAHGVHPAALAEEGLASALEDLATGSQRPVALDLQIAAGLDADAAMAAYSTVADAVTGTPAAPVAGTGGDVVQVQVRHNAGQMTVRLIVPGSATGELEEALGEATDRVAALGGTLAMHPVGRGVEVTAVIPCGSS
jgi:signal transduction histidine kinase